MAAALGIAAAQVLIRDAIARRIFPCATACVGRSDGINWREAFGHLTFDQDAAPARLDTWFDLASLTKPIATTTVVLDLVSRGRINLSDRVVDITPAWRGSDRAPVTIADLLEHASGLAARFADGPPHGRDAFLGDICALPLDYAPRSRALYSDLGFILLGLIAEGRAGRPLDELFRGACEPFPQLPASHDLRPHEVSFGVPADAPASIAPTDPLPEDVDRRHRLVGDVHDNYAAALGGVAGHAGLFGTAAGVAASAVALLRAARGQGNSGGPFSPAMTRRATRPSAVPGSSRALGWDLMRLTSSCGTRMSAEAFGHVGFTGTSLWIDPTRDRFYVLLTNRACGGGSMDEMRDVRRAFHDALSDV